MTLNPTVTPTWVRDCEIAHLTSRVQAMRRVSLMQQNLAVRAECGMTPEGYTGWAIRVVQSRKPQ